MDQPTASANAPQRPATAIATRRLAGGRRAFTIFELIVVVGVTGVLMSLVAVGLRTAQIGAQTTGCLANLRQLSVAHETFQSMNDGRFVDVGLPHGSIGNVERSFVTRLASYDRTIAELRSPLDDSVHWSPERGAGVPVGEAEGEPIYRRTSYGLNNYLSRSYSPRVALLGPGTAADRIQRIPRPDSIVSFVLMTETGSFASSDHPHVEEWGVVPEPARIARSQVEIAAIGGADGTEQARSNYAFLDGRVESLEFAVVYRDATENAFDPDVDRPFSP